MGDLFGNRYPLIEGIAYLHCDIPTSILNLSFFLHQGQGCN